MHQVQDNEVLVLLEKESRGRFSPGTSWAYSNSGYVVLGLIVAKASGVPYAEFLERRIFAPLNMRNTLAHQKGKNEIPHRAFGHSLEHGKLVLTDQSSRMVANPTGLRRLTAIISRPASRCHTVSDGFWIRIRDIRACGIAEPQSGFATSSSVSRWIA
jgi:hypothetical protein